MKRLLFIRSMYLNSRKPVFQTEKSSEAVARSVLKIVILKISQNSQENTCQYQSLIFNKVVGLSHKCFPVNFVKFSRVPFSTEHLWWLLLKLNLFLVFIFNNSKLKKIRLSENNIKNMFSLFRIETEIENPLFNYKRYKEKTVYRVRMIL